MQPVPNRFADERLAAAPIEAPRREGEPQPRKAATHWRQGNLFRFEPELVRQVVNWLEPLLRVYFRSEVRGVENFPSEQTMLVGNHDGGMLPIDGLILGAAWHRHFGFSRPLGVLVHDMVMRLIPSVNRIGAVLADRKNLESVFDAGYSVLVYPGGSREIFRSFFERKQLTLGNRTGFIKHALRRRLPITPVVSVGAHETLFVLWRGGWLADRLGITRHFRADVFPIVAGLPFGLWLGALMPHLPLPAKITVEVLPAIDIVKEAERYLGRPLRDEDIEDEQLVSTLFTRVRSTMQQAHSRLYSERRYPILG